MDITADKVKEAGYWCNQLLEINRQIQSCQRTIEWRKRVGYKFGKVIMFFITITFILLLIVFGLATYNIYHIYPDINSYPDWQSNNIFTNEFSRLIKNSFIVAIVVAFLISLFWGLKAANKDLKKIVQKQDELKKKIEDIIRGKMEVISMIPEKYRYTLATSYIAEVLECGRADTMKEALNLYEEQLHRWKMESKMDAMLKNQQSNNNLLWACVITNSIFR